MNKGFKSPLKSNFNPNPDLSELRKKELPPPSDNKSFIDNPVAALMMDDSNKKEISNAEIKINEEIDNSYSDKTDFINRKNMVETMIKSLPPSKKLKSFKLKTSNPYYNELKAKCHYLCDYSLDDTFFINLSLDALQIILDKHNFQLEEELYNFKKMIASKSKDEEKKQELEIFFLEFIKNRLK